MDGGKEEGRKEEGRKEGRKKEGRREEEVSVCASQKEGRKEGRMNVCVRRSGGQEMRSGVRPASLGRKTLLKRRLMSASQAKEKEAQA